MGGIEGIGRWDEGLDRMRKEGVEAWYESLERGRKARL